MDIHPSQLFQLQESANKAKKEVKRQEAQRQLDDQTKVLAAMRTCFLEQIAKSTEHSGTLCAKEVLWLQGRTDDNYYCLTRWKRCDLFINGGVDYIVERFVEYMRADKEFGLHVQIRRPQYGGLRWTVTDKESKQPELPAVNTSKPKKKPLIKRLIRLLESL